MSVLSLFIAEYPGFSRAAEMLEALPEASREKLKKKLDRPDVFLGEIMRLKIADACGADAGSICKGEHGKPYFEGRRDVAFNLSHSGDLAAGALVTVDEGNAPEVGVDIERIDRENTSRMKKISGRFFTDAERKTIDASRDPQAEFYLTWTRKESYLKYTGDGITRPLDNVDTLSLTETVFCSRIIRDSKGGEYAFSVCVPKGFADDENINFIKIV